MAANGDNRFFLICQVMRATCDRVVEPEVDWQYWK